MDTRTSWSQVYLCPSWLLCPSSPPCPTHPPYPSYRYIHSFYGIFVLQKLNMWSSPGYSSWESLDHGQRVKSWYQDLSHLAVLSQQLLSTGPVAIWVGNVWNSRAFGTWEVSLGKAPRLNIRRVIWILGSDVVFVTSTKISTNIETAKTVAMRLCSLLIQIQSF